MIPAQPVRRALAARLAAAALALALGGCAVQTRALIAAPPASLPARAELSRTPYFEQAAFQCGPASLAMALSAAGLAATPDDLIGRVFVPSRQGSLQIEMLAAARSRGAVATLLPASLEALLREIAAGNPVVILQNLGLAISPVWHYAVAIGYDLDAGEILLRSGPQPRERMALSTFEHTWDRSGRWAFVALAPGHLPATAAEPAATDALVAYERVAPASAARKAYQAAAARWPDSLVLAMGLGNTAYASGDLDAASTAFSDAARRHRDGAAYNNLAVVLDELGQRDAALRAARTAAALDGPWRAAARATLQRIEARPVESGPSR